MTVGLLFSWDSGWFNPTTEVTLWHDLAVSFGVDLLVMTPDLKIYNYQDLTFEKFDSIVTALDTLEGRATFVFLEPLDIIEANQLTGESLVDFVHPENALYIFGPSGRSNIGFYNSERGDKLVYIPTVVSKQIWALHAASIVLYDRAKKKGLI